MPEKMRPLGAWDRVCFSAIHDPVIKKSVCEPLKKWYGVLAIREVPTRGKGENNTHDRPCVDLEDHSVT